MHVIVLHVLPDLDRIPLCAFVCQHLFPDETIQFSDEFPVLIVLDELPALLVIVEIHPLSTSTAIVLSLSMVWITDPIQIPTRSAAPIVPITITCKASLTDFFSRLFCVTLFM